VTSLLRDWLALQCPTAFGAEAALLVVGNSRHASAASGARHASRPPDAEPTARLSATVEAVLQRGQASVQEPSRGLDPTLASSHIAVPLLRDGRLCGALGISIRGAAPGDTKAIRQRLNVGLASLVQILQLEDDRARIAALLSCATNLLDHEELAPAAHALASDLARELGCERVAIGLLRGGRLRVTTLSSSVQFSSQSGELRELTEAMQEALDQDALVRFPAGADGSPQVSHAHQNLLRGCEAGAVCTIPLAARGRAIGAMTFEWSHADRLDGVRTARIGQLAPLCGPMLELMLRAERTPGERARAWLSGISERHFGSVRLAGATLIVAALAIGLLLVAPGSYRVSARASLEGRVQRAVVAAIPGYLSEANARAGDLVQEGDVLARLDDRDLVLEERKWQSQRAQLEREYREALAGQNRTQISILRAQIDQVSAELGLAQEGLRRTRVLAPFDGIVLEGDLDRSLGSPVERGDVLFELAPLDGYRVIIEVDGRNIADVRPGQRGRLTLAALPNRSMALVVERITPISTARDGRNYFRVEAALEAPGEDLRPGMQGIAKIEAGRRRLLWIWTHELVDWLRLRLWSFLP